MKSEQLHRQKIDADYISATIRAELQNNISEIKASSSLTLDNIKKSMETALENMSKQRVITRPDYSNDLKLSKGIIFVYKVSYKNQLNSIHFITGKEDIKIKFITLNNENIDLAKEKAILELNKDDVLLDVMFDHTEEDPARIDILYTFRPIVSMNYYACNVTVAVWERE